YRERHKAWGFHLWMEVTLPEDADIIAVVKGYMALSEVDFAEPVYKTVLYSGVDPKDYFPNGNENYAPKLTVNDTQYDEQWHYNNTGQEGGTVDCDIDLPEAWDIERGNSDVLVAIQDMGIQLNHPDLDAHIWSGIGYDFQGMDSTIDPGFHGIHVAGTVSAESDNNTGVAGVAGGSGSGDGVTLMSVQVYSDTGVGGGNTNLPYEYSADNNAAISQNSWGYTSVNSYSQVVLDGIDYFNTNGGGVSLNGGLVIFAAGNDDATGNWYPGCYSGTMAVAATNFNDERSYYSNYGSWVEISAPGGEQYATSDPKGILSTYTNSKYDFIQGTSMACPHVSGVAALLISKAYREGVVLSSSEVRSLLADNTDYIDDINPSYSGDLGTGRLNANNSMIDLLSMLPGGTPPPTPTLISPADGSTTSDATPTFDWSDAPIATSYTILVDNNSNFSSPEIDQSPTSSTFTSGTDLTVGIYYWKVLATNSDGSSSYTAVWDFTIESA
ncbi:MAG: S8 family serine peptidase, partial [Candidatus Delongbacteria bacterium]|nr:S8 family serine peptidase [Candidatus Delongbacteria bacterium]